MITGIALGKVTAWNNCPLRTEKGTGCPNLQTLLLGSVSFVCGESQMLKASKQASKTNPKPTKLKMLLFNELRFIMKKKKSRCC